MSTLIPDPTFYPSPKMAMQAPPEEHAYTLVLSPNGNGLSDALALLEMDPNSSTYRNTDWRIR
jgi:selenium-binding protein 1